MAQTTDVTRANGTRAHDIASVVLRVPADRDYIVLVRSAAGHLGARLGYSLPEILDLRLAVDEACNLFLTAPVTAHVAATEPEPEPAPTSAAASASASDLECRFSVSDSVLSFAVSGSAAGVTEPDTGGIGWQVLSALADTVSWGADGTTACLALEKRHEPGWR